MQLTNTCCNDIIIINRSNIYYSQRKKEVKKVGKDDITKKLDELKPVLQNKYNVKRIGVFGSYARDEQGEESDIDLLVEFNKPVGLKFVSLKLFLEKAFNKKVDLVTKNALRKEMKEDILKEVKY